MGRNPKIKLSILSEKQLDKLISCYKCGNLFKHRNLYYYVDESNISITKNSKGICLNCK